jgi:hypothetical protein
MVIGIGLERITFAGGVYVKTDVPCFTVKVYSCPSTRFAVDVVGVFAPKVTTKRV